VFHNPIKVEGILLAYYLEKWLPLVLCIERCGVYFLHVYGILYIMAKESNFADVKRPVFESIHYYSDVSTIRTPEISRDLHASIN